MECESSNRSRHEQEYIAWPATPSCVRLLFVRSPVVPAVRFRPASHRSSVGFCVTASPCGVLAAWTTPRILRSESSLVLSACGRCQQPCLPCASPPESCADGVCWHGLCAARLCQAPGTHDGRNRSRTIDPGPSLEAHRLALLCVQSVPLASLTDSLIQSVARSGAVSPRFATSSSRQVQAVRRSRFSGFGCLAILDKSWECS